MSGYYSKRFRDELEAAVAEAYADELGASEITPRDGFGALSGYVAAASRVALRVSRVTSAELTAASVIEHDTVERVAAHLRSQKPADSCVQLPSGAVPGAVNLFYFHSASGNAFAIRTLRDHLPVQLTGVRAAGLHGERDVPTTIDEFATIYLEQVLRVQPDGPYLLCGFSTGGTIAFEIARRLRESGAEVGLLAMFDSQPPDPTVLSRLQSEEDLKRGRLRELLRRVGDTPDAEVAPGDAGVVEALRRSHALAEEMDDETLERQLLVFARTLRADRLYEPGRYEGEVHYFAADTPVEVVPDWKPHMGALHLHDIDAEHYEYAIFANQEFRSIFADLVREALAGRTDTG
ncbi:thioesterase domain-containing protein [Umezawaea sp. Da 62-37]|uniref:thioesterase domain-containing protein n=1 Tax=Umezawaea sp. Da 62-37 TaxID=3075927 RepID=UPI0028F7378D|nr:thioesterase domain-containing protein [Umezawaea sp. Da 62-37]WNV87674.1 thioesterase domain-containing protein [Umezawaea sp. Da 62-37]